MKKLILPFLLLMSMIVTGCRGSAEDICDKYSKGYCSSKELMNHMPIVTKVDRDASGDGVYMCMFSCVELVSLEEIDMSAI